MEKLPHFSRRLRELRAASKLTQVELAQRAGIARNTVCRLEVGLREPSWIMVQKLIAALKVPVTAFVDPAIIPPVVEEPRRPGRPRIYDRPDEGSPPSKCEE